MKVKIHKADIGDLAHLNQVREGIEAEHSCISTGSLKQRDVRITWHKDDDFITVESKDIKI